MRRIVGVTAIDAPGRDHADRSIRLVLLHRTCLHGRGLRAQQNILRDVEGILHIARGVILRQVERLKVVVVRLNLRAFLYRKAHLQKDFLDAVQRDRERMEMSDLHRAAGQRDVDLLGVDLGRQYTLGNFLGLLCEELLKLGTRLVDDLADARTFLLREGAHAAHEGRQLSLFPQNFDTYIVKLTQRARRLCNRSSGTRLEFSDLFVHNVLLYVHVVTTQYDSNNNSQFTIFTPKNLWTCG